MRSVRCTPPWRSVLAGATLLLLGAAAPSACQPASKPLATLYGDVTHSSFGPILADPPCPLVEVGPGLTERGTRSKWGLRVAAADPGEWISLRPCTTFGSAATTTLSDTAFTIYTATGDVTGTAVGVQEDLTGEITSFRVALTVTGGTKAYRTAKGTAYLTGCRTASGGHRIELGPDPGLDVAARCERLRPS